MSSHELSDDVAYCCSWLYSIQLNGSQHIHIQWHCKLFVLPLNFPNTSCAEELSDDVKVTHAIVDYLDYYKWQWETQYVFVAWSSMIKDILEVICRNRGKWKANSHQECNPGHLAWAISAPPLSCDNQTITTPSESSIILHRWYLMLHCTPGSHSVGADRKFLPIRRSSESLCLEHA